MRKFPPASEVQFLVGEEIGQICLDPYSLQFRFVGGGQITIEQEVDYVDEKGHSFSYDCQKDKDKAVCFGQLLLKKIIEVSAQDYCLLLRFENGAMLKLFSNEGSYECGQIYPKGENRCLGMIVF